MAHSNITKNYIFNLSYQILAILVPVITAPYTSRVLGAEGIGTYSFTYSIVTYFTLAAALGTITYAQREIAYVQQNSKAFTKIFWEIVILRMAASLICSLLYLIFIRNTGNFTVGFIQGLYLIGTATDISWFFQGIEEFSKIIFRNMLIKLINIAFIFLCVKGQDDLLLYLFGMAFLPILGNILLWFHLPKYLVIINPKCIHPLRHLKHTIQLFIPTVAIQIYTVLDKTMIGIFTSSNEQNGYYEQSISLVRVSLTLITSLGTVMIPRISNTFASGNLVMLKTYMKQTYQFVWFLSFPLFGGLLMTASTFVPWFFGEGFGSVTILIQIFSFLMIAVGLNDVTGMQYLIPVKKHNIFTITVLIGAVTNLGLNLLLIPLYAAKGAAIASIIAESVITITQFIYVIYIEKTFTWHDILGKSWKYAFSCVVMMAGLAIIKRYLPNTISATFILILSGIVIYLGILLGIKDEFLKSLFYKMSNMIKSRFRINNH